MEGKDEARGQRGVRGGGVLEEDFEEGEEDFDLREGDFFDFSPLGLPASLEVLVTLPLISFISFLSFLLFLLSVLLMFFGFHPWSLDPLASLMRMLTA